MIPSKASTLYQRNHDSTASSSEKVSIFPRRRSHIDRLGLAVGLFSYLLAQAWPSALIEGRQLNG
jgi:hypothetical protein